MTAQTQPKKRGGQPGNSNALKHGVYAETLHRGTLLLKQKIQTADLALEQQFISHLFNRIEQQLGQPLQNCTPTDRTIYIFIFAVHILTHLLHTQGTLKGRITPEVETALAQVFHDLLSE